MRLALVALLSALLCFEAASLAGCKSAAEQAAEVRAAQATLDAEAEHQHQLLLDAQKAAEERARREQADQYRAAIERALHEDLLTGKDSTPGHIVAMRSIDLAQCPPEFRVAYMKHIHAWEESVAVHQAKAELDGQDDAAAAAGILSTMFGSDATPYSDHLKAKKQIEAYQSMASADINTSFQSVEEIAALYGAKIPN